MVLTKVRNNFMTELKNVLNHVAPYRKLTRNEIRPWITQDVNLNENPR